MKERARSLSDDGSELDNAGGEEKASVREICGTSLAVQLDVGGRLGPASRGLADPFTHCHLICARTTDNNDTRR